jgi:hypothetical protein
MDNKQSRLNQRPKRSVPKKNYSEESDVEEEDANDLTIPKDHWQTVMEEVPENYKFKENVLYMARIWIRSLDKYLYKVGYTDGGLDEYIEELHTKYDSCGRIIIIMACHVKNQKKERSVYKLLKPYNVDVTVKFTKHTELYEISPESYDAVWEQINKFANLKFEVFESEKYILGDDLGETFNGKKLDQDSKEDKFWKKRIWGMVG